MMYRITKNTSSLEGSILLPASKSESNRALILQALAGGSSSLISNLSPAKDTETLAGILADFMASPVGQKIYDVGPAGTTFRFLTSFFAATPGTDVVLTGSERMKQRPVRILAEALKKLGADIEYAGESGYPPLRIKGKVLKGGTVEIDSSVSSQYISSLLLIAPTLSEGLEIVMKGTVISDPYIQMTVDMMKAFGAKVEKKERRIRVSPRPYEKKAYEIEGDWSAASYWFSAVALADSAAITIHGLKEKSMQGDSVIRDFIDSFGVSCHYSNGTYILEKKGSPSDYFSYDFINCPDIAQTITVMCAGNNISCELIGLQSLKIKETDRIEALVAELGKMNVRIMGGKDMITIREGGIQSPAGEVCIDTYEDHRMAMAFAPLALKTRNICIKNPSVVVKSYPAFWEDLQKLGFNIQEVKAV